MRKSIGDPQILTRKIPSFHKYDEVRAQVNSGGNVLKLAEVAASARPNKDEPFKRMKPSSLQRLLTEPEPEVQVILLDMRTAEEYKACHIDKALSYPTAMLSRSMNPFLPEIFANKNKPGVMIVAYDFDEKIAAAAAALMFQKGIDNMCLLSGGLQRYLTEGLPGIVGTAPVLPRPPPSSAGSLRRERSIASSENWR